MRRWLTGIVCISLMVTWLWRANAVRAQEEEKDAPLVQMAILLDTSGSMSGLIAQAKTQLWRIVNEFATAKQDGRRPEFQVALYEYGKSSIPADEGYIRMICPLTDDLDKISEELFALKTNGGSEYCGQVIKAAVEGLKWSAAHNDYKVIFIAGNEPFTQGSVDYRESCKAAVTRGIIVNTIHCGSYEEGVNGKWKDGALLADGSYSHIDQNRKLVHIEAPQDAEIARLGTELNTTYVAYGAEGKEGLARQGRMDLSAEAAAPGANVQRQIAKGGQFYTNTAWDLVDALAEETVELEDVKDEDLPEEMRDMSAEEREAYVAAKGKKRAGIQEQIKKLSDERKAFVVAEMKKLADKGEDTLEAAVISSVRAQAEKRGFEFEQPEQPEQP